MDRKKLMDQMMETFFSDMHRRCVLFDIVIFFTNHLIVILIR
jgi:hypothetical protein